MNINLDKMREEILQEIKKRGYESLRYSVLENEKYKGEWENHIDFENGKFYVYSTMDRASVAGKYDFESSLDAKNKFFELLDLTVKINRRSIERNKLPEYSSPLWDK